MSLLSRCLIAFVVLISITFSAYAQTKVVVIPLGGDDGDGCDPCYSQTITVAPSGADFDDPALAMRSIDKSLPQEDYRILVKIAAGAYTMTSPLNMREYVDVEGAGTDETTGTELIGALSSSGLDLFSAAIVNGSDNAELRDMNVVNTGGNCVSLGMLNNRASPTVRNVNFDARGASCDGPSFNAGIFNRTTRTIAQFYNVISSASSGSETDSFGMYNDTGAFSIAEDSGFVSTQEDSSVQLGGGAVAAFRRGLVSGVSVLGGSIIRCIDTVDQSDEELDNECRSET